MFKYQQRNIKDNSNFHLDMHVVFKLEIDYQKFMKSSLKCISNTLDYRNLYDSIVHILKYIFLEEV